jgi:surfeit locus 1 family protein
MNETITQRRFRPRWWAALLALSFAILTIYLGNWQGGKADWKIAQQTQLEAARGSAATDVFSGPTNEADAIERRYRPVVAKGRFDATQLFFIDNRVQEGKAGYVIAQLFIAERDGATKHFIVDRGWLQGLPDRATLPALDSPSGAIEITGRINLPQSRNPGSAANTAGDKRINYLNLTELSAQLKVKLEPYVIEQTAGPGFLGTPRAAPSMNFEKNRAYQVQWYAFAALAVILFIVLSFRKVAVS